MRPPTADDGSPYSYVLVTTHGGGRPGDTSIRLSDGRQLGHVQAISWSISVGGLSTCVIQTFLDPVELKILLSDTTIKIQLWRHPLKELWTYYSQQLLWRGWYRLFPKAKAKALDRLLKGKD